VIAGLRLLGASPIVAADFSADRREKALRMGADIAIDPQPMTRYAPLP
jgi:threonine dehydrogenase-like Zn-dependent dehydrogenase